jgi:hypothetical protein
VGCDAIWCKKWIAYLSKGSYQNIPKYIDVFMKSFLDDFRIINDVSIHLEKLKKCLLQV